MRYVTFFTLICVLLSVQFLPAQAPDTLWTKTYGGSGYERGASIQETSDSGYIVAGETYSFAVGPNDVYLLRTDSLGDTLWTRTYGGDSTDAANSLATCSAINLERL